MEGLAVVVKCWAEPAAETSPGDVSGRGEPKKETTYFIPAGTLELALGETGGCHPQVMFFNNSLPSDNSDPYLIRARLRSNGVRRGHRRLVLREHGPTAVQSLPQRGSIHARAMTGAPAANLVTVF